MVAVLRHIALLVADEPELAGAVTTALLGSIYVEHLRFRIGREIHERLCSALGAQSDSEVVESLEQLYAGVIWVGRHAHASDAETASAGTVGRLLLTEAPAVSRRNFFQPPSAPPPPVDTAVRAKSEQLFLLSLPSQRPARQTPRGVWPLTGPGTPPPC